MRVLYSNPNQLLWHFLVKQPTSTNKIIVFHSTHHCCVVFINFVLCQSLGEKGSPGEIRTSPGDPGQKGQKGLFGNPGPEGETVVTQKKIKKLQQQYFIFC